MSKKKSYMKNNTIIKEGFFDNLLQIFKVFPQLRKNSKIKKDIQSLNKKVETLEKMMNDEMKDYGSKKKIKLNKFKLKDFGLGEKPQQGQPQGTFDPFSQSSLETPGVNPANFNTATLNQGTVGTTGLTSTEQALLTPEEQAIRLRQRGMA